MKDRPKPVEEILPEVWQVVDELRRLTEGLERTLHAIAKKGAPGGTHDS